MKICIYGRHNFLRPLIKTLEMEGIQIYHNKFSEDADLVITFGGFIYKIYKNLKFIKKKRIKLINVIYEIPVWHLQYNHLDNSWIKSLKQYLFHCSHRYSMLSKILSKILTITRTSTRFEFISELLNNYFNSLYYNRVYYQFCYKNYLKKADLNLSLSKFSQITVKRFLKLNTKVWYPGVDSNLLTKLPSIQEFDYDIINISRIAWWKRQDLIARAANILRLKILIIGRPIDKSINLECPVVFLPDHQIVLEKLNRAKLYIDASISEGFGLTPVEAAFLEKVTIVSNTYIHREVLGAYPIYFKPDDLSDLVQKIELALKGTFELNIKALELIKEKFSLDSAKNRLLKYIQLM